MDWKIIAAVLWAACCSTTASAKEPLDLSMQEIMALSKTAGLCGSFAQLIKFQSNTELPGGDAVVVRFIETESARLGKTKEEMMEGCRDVVTQYDTLFTLFGEL